MLSQKNLNTQIKGLFTMMYMHLYVLSIFSLGKVCLTVLGKVIIVVCLPMAKLEVANPTL